MKNLSKLIKYHKDDIYNNNLNKINGCSYFFKKSILHLSISLEIGSSFYDNELISFEKLCKNIPNKIGSRSSIQNILNEGVSLGYFNKEESKYDRRIKNYSFSNKYSIMIEDWISNNRKNYIDSKISSD